MRGLGRVLVPVLLVALSTTTWLVVGANGHDDPRNRSEAFFEAQNGARCYSCHVDFDPMRIGLVERFSHVEVGSTEVLQMRVRHVSGMGHFIKSIAVVVNLSAAPNVAVADANFTPDLDEARRLVLSGEHTEGFAIGLGAERVRVVARAVGEETLAPAGLGGGSLSLVVSNDAGTRFHAVGDALEKVVERTGDAARDMGVGDFYATMAWDSDVDPEMEVVLELQVTYARSATEHRFELPGVSLRSGESATVEMPIMVTGPGKARLDLRVESVSYYSHAAGSPAPRDDGLYYRFTSMVLEGGDATVRTAATAAPVPVGPAVDLHNLFARIVGFVTLVLVPVALVTGGVFGKASRRWMNRMTGGPKRRVLWHMAMSWAIILLATGHFALALVETRFAWSKGLFWGGVAWALLATLGFSGYYQSRIIKRWGYAAWRHVHLWPAVAVLVFGVLHMAFDGSDLAALRRLVPGSDRMSWP